MKIYILIWGEAEYRAEVYPYKNKEDALKDAESFAYENQLPDFEEGESIDISKVDGLLFHSVYSDEGDYIQVVEKELECTN